MGSKSKAAHWFNGVRKSHSFKCDQCGASVEVQHMARDGKRRLCSTHGKPGAAPSELSNERIP